MSDYGVRGTLASLVLPLVPLVMFPLTTGCAAVATSGGGGEGEASCAFAVEYGGREYIDVGKVDHTLGAEVGTAQHSICVDTGGSEEDTGDDIPSEDLTVYEAYAIKGIDTDDAIAVRESPGAEVSVMVHRPEDEPLTDAAERIFGGDGDGEGDGDGSGQG
ncbi:DUF6281 family protein [Streptomyces tailanensis]|uniref:DUF6281 family protein n=1 Tax=Streptomyces tailanensis TaxID=2569858 RepID=UPI00122E18A7|nr:DUF6281 family protein [Streptomyces tailanensis]